jgi:hypothetical protein
MIDFIVATTNGIFANWERFLIGGVIVVCAIIVLEGLLKKFLIGKIENKLLRKVILSLTSLVLVFPATAIYFVSDNIPFDYYWFGCIVVAVLTIITYWLYENTALRNAIAFIGNKTIVKFATILYNAVTKNEEPKDVRSELYTATQELKKATKKKLNETDITKL